jgi:hypothetical protein
MTLFSFDRRRLGLLLFLILVPILAAAPPAGACSMCRCGDPTFNALGTDVYVDGKLRVAFDWERFDKDQGSPEARESMLENRFTTALSYTLGDRVTAVVRIPYSSREQSGTETGTERETAAAAEHAAEHAGGGHVRETASDLADPELYTLVRLWSSSFTGGLGRRAWISALGGVKTDWGRNDLEAEGARLDEHLQAGTGSTDVFAGLSGFYLLNHTSSLFGSVQVRRTGTNDFGYRYGNIRMASFGVERKITETFDGVVTLDFRDAERDLAGEEGVDPDTGGRVLYVSPRLSRDFGRGLVGRLAVQVPVYRDLNGDQKEKTVVNAGLTFLF